MKISSGASDSIVAKVCTCKSFPLYGIIISRGGGYDDNYSINYVHCTKFNNTYNMPRLKMSYLSTVALLFR